MYVLTDVSGLRNNSINLLWCALHYKVLTKLFFIREWIKRTKNAKKLKFFAHLSFHFDYVWSWYTLLFWTFHLGLIYFNLNGVINFFVYYQLLKYLVVLITYYK